MSCIPYLIFGIVIITIEYRRLKKNKKIDLFSAVSLVFLVYYIFTPIVLNLNKENLLYSEQYKPTYVLSFLEGNNSYILSFLVITTAYTLLYIAFSSKKYPMSIKKMNQCLNMELWNKKRLYYIAIIFLGISVICMLYYCIRLGGIQNSIAETENYRTVYSNESWLIIRFFFPLVIISSMITMILKKQDEKLIGLNIITIISLIFTVYYLLITGSRGKIVLFILGILFVFVRKIKPIHFIIGGVFIAFMFVFGDALLSLDFSDVFDDFNNVIIKLAVQTSYPFINSLKIDSIIDYTGGYRYFSDLIYVWFVNIMPSSVTIFDNIPNTTALWHTLVAFYQYGAGGIPVDFITFSYFQLGFIGIILLSFGFGKIITFINYLLKNSKGYMFKYLFFRSFMALIDIFLNAEIEVFIRANIDIILFIMLYITFDIFNKRRNKNEY